MRINQNAAILCRGELSKDKCGCGSGGSILIKSPTIFNSGLICARGGCHKGTYYGAGGYGRIRIDCNNFAFTRPDDFVMRQLHTPTYGRI